MIAKREAKSTVARVGLSKKFNPLSGSSVMKSFEDNQAAGDSEDEELKVEKPTLNEE